MILVLDNIRSTYNVGAILRTAEGFGVEGVVLSGYTPRVHDKKLLPHLRAKIDKEIHKTALGAEDMLEIYSSDDIISLLNKYKANDYQLIGLENNIDTNNIFKLNDVRIRSIIGNKIILVLGEEVNGISELIRKIIDYFIEIPMKGKKESFNVSVAAGIAMYGIMNL